MTNKRSVGKLIEEEVRKQQIPITQFAEMICCNRNNVYDIFKRNKMDILQLKQISKVLKRNFFKELAEDDELINEGDNSEKDILEQKIVSQFLSIFPDVMCKLGKSSFFIFGKDQEVPGYEDCPVPDFMLMDYNITFTIGQTFNERLGYCAACPIVSIPNEYGCPVEFCCTLPYGSKFLNIKLENKTAEEWESYMRFVFEVYSKYVEF